MIIGREDKPVVAAIHPRLIEELRVRKETIERETERKAQGGITCFSEMAALELRSIRQSGDNIIQEILKLKTFPVKKFNENGVEREYIPYEIFKKVLILSSVLKLKKDQKVIQMEISKIRGLKKNEIRYFW